MAITKDGTKPNMEKLKQYKEMRVKNLSKYTWSTSAEGKNPGATLEKGEGSVEKLLVEGDMENL